MPDTTCQCALVAGRLVSHRREEQRFRPKNCLTDRHIGMPNTKVVDMLEEPPRGAPGLLVYEAQANRFTREERVPHC